MILRRLATSLRQQDWVTVVIEIMIVVLGVFIGLQVNNWNSERVARRDAANLLERMLSEAEAALRDMAAYQEVHAGILDNALKLSVGLQEADTCLRMGDGMKHLVLSVGDFPPPRFSLAMAREALENRSLSMVGSSSIRDEVRAIIDEMTFIDRQWQRYIQVKQDSERAIYMAAGLRLTREEALSLKPSEGWTGLDQYALQTPQGVCGVPEMVAFATNAATTQHIYTIYLYEVSHALNEYAAVLAAEANGMQATGKTTR